jgi:hypothetical protein
MNKLPTHLNKLSHSPVLSKRMTHTSSSLLPGASSSMPEVPTIRNMSVHDDFVEHTMMKKEEIFERVKRMTQQKEFNDNVDL